MEWSALGSAGCKKFPIRNDAGCFMTSHENMDPTLHDVLDHLVSRRVDPASDLGEVVLLAYKDGHDEGFKDGLDWALALFARWVDSLKGQDLTATQSAADLMKSGPTLRPPR